MDAALRASREGRILGADVPYLKYVLNCLFYLL
jgi:hypothetical protein